MKFIKTFATLYIVCIIAYKLGLEREYILNYWVFGSIFAISIYSMYGNKEKVGTEEQEKDKANLELLVDCIGRIHGVFENDTAVTENDENLYRLIQICVDRAATPDAELDTPWTDDDQYLYDNIRAAAKICDIPLFHTDTPTPMEYSNDKIFKLSMGILCLNLFLFFICPLIEVEVQDVIWYLDALFTIGSLAAMAAFFTNAVEETTGIDFEQERLDREMNDNRSFIEKHPYIAGYAIVKGVENYNNIKSSGKKLDEITLKDLNFKI